MILAVIATLLGIGIIASLEIIKKKWWKELAIYIIIFLMGSALVVLQTANVKLPSVGDGVRFFAEKILHLRYW